jgi:hypothetical protein
MIFDWDKMNVKIAKIFNGETGTTITGRYVAVNVYKGTQPTATAYEANYSSLYTSDDSGGSELLCVYGSVNGSTNYQTARDGAKIYSGTSMPATYYRDGTATWAAVFFDADDVDDGTLTSSRRNEYIIVPVTDPSGTGIVRLNSTTVSGTAPAFADLNLTFAGSL